MYLYTINMPSNQEMIAQFECWALTGVWPDKNYALSSRYADIRETAYMDICVNIFFQENSLESLYEKIDRMDYKKEGFLIKFINTGSHVDFKTRKDIERTISDIFTVGPDLKNPRDIFAVTNMDGMWMFGQVAGHSENRWLRYNKKPHTFCNALNARMARALVNIGCSGSKDVKFLDPCCGMGTVVIEAMDMGLDAHGFDINKTVADNAGKNLSFFGFENTVIHGDASEIQGMYDVSVVDLPYGVLSITSADEHRRILSGVRKVCKRSVILSSEDISDLIASCGFRIIKCCISHKGGLDRHISLCM